MARPLIARGGAECIYIVSSACYECMHAINPLLHEYNRAEEERGRA